MPETNKAAEEIIADNIAAFNESDFARLLNMNVITAHDGYAEVEMDCTGKMNPHGVAHGGAIFSVADHAFGIAANCAGTDRVAVSVHIQYIAPAKGRLVAKARKVADNGKYSTFRILVYDSDRLVADFEGVSLQVNPRGNGRV
jgi:acyl-CoA thioesterase